MNLLKPVVLLIFLLSVVSTVTAIPPITLEISDLHDTISSDQSATFVLSVNNNQNVDDEFYISAPRSQWDISFETYYLRIKAGGTKSVHVRMSPPITAPVGKYGIYFETKSGTNPEIMEYRYVHVNINESLAPPPVQLNETKLVTELTITEKEATDTLLKRSYSILLNNTGETLIKDKWTDLFSELDVLLLSSTPEYSSISDYGKLKKIDWEYSLEPGESTVISYTVSYYPLIYGGGLLLLALIALAFYYSSAFKVNKSISKSKRGDKTLRVELAVVNKTKKTKKSIVIEDYIPIPFDLVKQFTTIEPDAITKHGTYTKLKWKLPELSPKEERIFSYNIRSRLKVVGVVRLPQAILTYSKGKRKITAVSKVLNVIGKDFVSDK